MTPTRASALAGDRAGNFAGFAVCIALLGYALYSQHALGLEPCPLCILQRIAVLATGLVFLGAALHVWITAQPPGTVAECGASLDYMLDVLPLREVLAKVLTGSGECGKVEWRFLGLSMPAWVLAWLLALGAWGLFVNLRRR